MDVKEISAQLKRALSDLEQAMPFSDEMLLVVGTSTSEVAGERIGSSGSEKVAIALYEALSLKQKETGIKFAFQCCEHLNRALLIEKSVAKERHYEFVSAIPIREAGGAMAAYAYGQMEDPVLVEEVQAEVGIDIGDTLIGMHLRKVAVPVRSGITQIGQAHLTMAMTRPKLIGGARAVYER